MPKSPNPLVIGLHRVGLPPAEAMIRGLFISPRLLAFQMKLITRMGYSFSTLREALVGPGGKVAVLTFDDGYEDILQALPILRSYGAPATVFVITADVGKRSVVWDEAGEKIPADLLSWNSLAVLHQQGWEIASHCHRHVHLTRYSAAEQFELIDESIRLLRGRFPEQTVSFAYPYNNYDATTRAIVQKLGIKQAVTTNSYRGVVTSNDPLQLSRVSLGGCLVYHYFKSSLRLAQAVGLLNVFGALLNVRGGLERLRIGFHFALKSLYRSRNIFLTTQTKTISTSTDDDVVPRAQGA